MAEGTLHQLARITPQRHAAALSSPDVLALPTPSPKEKAAIIVRFLMEEGVQVPVAQLPDHMQAALTEQMGRMRLINRNTLTAVLREFLDELEAVGLSFPGGIEAALSLMDGHISTSAANRLRRLAGASAKADPWDRLTQLPVERLLPVVVAESTEVSAVMLCKLPVSKAADLLGQLPGDRARRVAYAMSKTASVDPETVRRIGLSLAAQLDAQPARAFDAGPVERVAAILNVSSSTTRDDVFQGLEAEDSSFAELVRRAIFTFAHIPDRIVPRDVPKIVRMVDQGTMVTALVGAQASARDAPSVEFILSNMSQRLAQSLREEMAARGAIKDKEAESAMAAVVMMIRQLEGAGEIVLITPEM